MPFQPKNNESLLYNFLWGCIHHIRGLVRASRQSPTKHLMKNYSRLSVYFVHCHRGDLCKAMTTMTAIVRYPPAPAVTVNIPLLGQVFSHLNCRVGYFNLQEPSFEFTIVGSVWFLNCWVGCLSWERSALRQKNAPCEWPKRRRKQKYMGRLTPTIQEYLE